MTVGILGGTGPPGRGLIAISRRCTAHSSLMVMDLP